MIRFLPPYVHAMSFSLERGTDRKNPLWRILQYVFSPKKSHNTLSGPVLRDPARLSQRYPPPYCALWGFWCLNMANWGGCPSPSSEHFPLGQHAKWRCDTPRGISAILARYPMKTRQKRYPPLRHHLERVLHDIGGGGVSHTGPLGQYVLPPHSPFPIVFHDSYILIIPTNLRAVPAHVRERYMCVYIYVVGSKICPRFGLFCVKNLAKVESRICPIFVFAFCPQFYSVWGYLKNGLRKKKCIFVFVFFMLDKAKAKRWRKEKENIKKKLEK